MPENSVLAKEDRLSVRVPKEIKDRIKRAATLSGITMSDFIVANLLPAANNVIQGHDFISVSSHDFDLLTEALNNPPKPNQSLLNTVREYKAAVNLGEIVVSD